MVNVLIHDVDSFFSNGMTELMKDLLTKNNHDAINFLYEYNDANIAVADIIIVSMCQGEQVTCWPDLCHKKRAKIIVVMNRALKRRAGKMPWCFDNTLFIYRTQSRVHLEEQITELLHHDSKNRDYLFKSCENCSRKMLSAGHQETALMFLEHTSFSDISQKLSVSIKTVYSRRTMLKEFFYLHTDSELFNFIMAVKKRGSFE